MAEKPSADLHACLAAAADDSRTNFPVNAQFSSTTTAVTPTSMTSTPQRDKRRFYVKKAAIGIGHFKEWEEKLGDSWYRHHNKVNNIVYYHCKHEPCYASMKAKVMVDFVQLYVTEEGHTHPPFSNSVNAQTDITNVTLRSDFTADTSKITDAHARRSMVQLLRRKRVADEKGQQGMSFAYQQHILNELWRMQSGGSEHLKNEVPMDQMLGSQEIPREDEINIPSTSAVDIKTETSSFSNSIIVETANGTANLDGRQSPPRINGSESSRFVGDDRGPVADQPVALVNNSGVSISPSSSADVRGTAGSMITATDPLSQQAASRDSDEDDRSSDSDDSVDVNVDIPSNTDSPFQTNPSDSTDNLFTIIKAKIESKEPRRRLRYLRKLKRQLCYYVEMEEIRYLASKLPPSTKYEDIFNNHII